MLNKSTVLACYIRPLPCLVCHVGSKLGLMCTFSILSCSNVHVDFLYDLMEVFALGALYALTILV